MYKIQANKTGTRLIEVAEEHLATLEKYQLLRNLVDSNGIIDEVTLKCQIIIRIRRRFAKRLVRFMFRRYL